MSLAKTSDITSNAATRVVSTRRGLVGGAAAVILGTGVTGGVAASVADLVPTNPDAVLIALCANAETIDDRSSALMATTDDVLASDPRWSPTVDESARLFAECKKDMNQAAKISAATPDGLRAKASLALREIDSSIIEDYPLVFSVLNQLAGMA